MQIGLKNLANLVSIPALSAIFIIPDHNTIVGNKLNINFKALSALVNILSLITFIFPVKKLYKIPITIKNVHNIEIILKFMINKKK